MSTIFSVPEQRVLLENIKWSTYEAILRDAETPRGRIAYNEGVLEIMAPSKVHEHAKRLIGRMIESYTEELGIDICSVSSTTFKREDLRRGFESDECYYLAHAPDVRDRNEIDLTVDPPPDLVVEVDISRTSMPKFPIYGALGVPEVWRYDGKSLSIHVRREDQQYDETRQSKSLPRLPIEKMVELLDQRQSQSETLIIRSFRAWIREKLGSV